MHLLLIAMIGVLGGITSGLFGVGGGVLFVPLLILFGPFDPHLAIGTSLAAIVPTAMVGAWKHGSVQLLDWKTALLLALFAMLGAWLGATLSLKLDSVLLKRFYSLFLILIAVKLFFSK